MARESLKYFDKRYLFSLLLMILIFVVGECTTRLNRYNLEHPKKSTYYEIPTGVIERTSPPKKLNIEIRNDDCISKKEFYEGMEDAEMRGKEDDPSAKDIYDEFNR